MVALVQALHALAYLDHDAGTLVAEDGREQAFRVLAGTGELVGVADSGGLDLDQALGLPWDRRGSPFRLKGVCPPRARPRHGLPWFPP